MFRLTLVALFLAAPLQAQTVGERIADLERSLAEMKAVSAKVDKLEAKIDALTAKVDRLSGVTATAMPSDCVCPKGACLCSSNKVCETGQCPAATAVAPAKYHYEEWNGRMWQIPDGWTVDHSRLAAPAAPHFAQPAFGSRQTFFGRGASNCGPGG